MKNSIQILLQYRRYLFLSIEILLVISLFRCSSSTRYTRPSYREQNNAKTKAYNRKKIQKEKKDTKKTEQTLKESSDPQKNRSFKKVLFEKKLKRVVASYLGVRYRYGGTSRRGMDCSGFVWRVFQDLGEKDFPRTSSAHLTKMGKPVFKKNAKPGDLIFFKNRNKIDHVGIYMGNKKFVHASSSQGVTYTSVYSEYYKKRYYCIRRIL